MFDPAQPASNSPLDSQVMRAQLTGLKDLIDALQSINAAQVDAVSTGNPGDPAAAAVSVSGSTLHFTFSLPRGDSGGTGGDGQAGQTGPPGEVTNAQLASAIASTSSNTNALNTLPFGPTANYDPQQQQEIIDKINELINALRR